MQRGMRRAFLIAVISPGAALAVVACSVGPDYTPRSAADLGVPPTWSVRAAPTPEDLTRWWQRFDDPVLGRLVEQAASANLDVAQAIARLRQAREAMIQSRASLLPSLSGSGGYSRSETLRGGGQTITLPDGTVQNIGGGGGANNFSLGLSGSYQLGIFGEVRRTVEASRADYQASGFDYATTLLSVEQEVARNYVLARLYQAQLANARASLALQEDNLEIAGFRVQAGLVSSLDLEQARGQRAQTAATIPTLEQQYNAAVSRLGVLTAQAPGALKPLLVAARPIPNGPALVGAGIPADVLRQRPDVRAAERSLAAATARIGVAEAALYPNLAISGNIDARANTVGSILDTVTGGLFAGLTQAIFDGGKLRSQVRGQRAAADAALAAYKSTVLTALEDIENAVVALDTARRREVELTTAYRAADAAAILSRSQYHTGLTDFTTLSQQEAALLSARNGAAQARADAATALVQLYGALGGGWDASAVPEAPPRAAAAAPLTQPAPTAGNP